MRLIDYLDSLNNDKIVLKKDNHGFDTKKDNYVIYYNKVALHFINEDMELLDYMKMFSFKIKIYYTPEYKQFYEAIRVDHFLRTKKLERICNG